MAMLPDCRGRGIGTRLLERALAATGARGEQVSLSVSADNPALKLYERAGFVQVEGKNGAITMLRPRDT